MDNNSEYLKKFESALKEDTKRKKLVLYSNNKHQNVQDIKPQYNCKDVISKVDSELKAIQRADYVRSSKIVVKNLDKYKNSEFLSVSQLPKTDEVNQERQTNKFETQCVSDTQLINIVQDAEAKIHKGITQELDTLFHYTSIDDDHASKSKKENVISDSENIFESEHDVPCNSKQLVAQENMRPNKKIKDFNEDFSVIKSNIQVYEYMAKYDIHEKQNNKVIKECFKNEPNLSQIITITDKENPPSPILHFNDKTLKITPNTSPLVFNLESFEKFENIAVPLIEENSNIETAKYLINSQIIGKELCLDINREPKLHEETIVTSEQFKINDKNVQIDKTSYSPQNYIKENVVIKEEINEYENNFKLNKTLEDAILFSSDEEEDYNKKPQELPFTCVLDTSYYDQLNMLDKTMYVGFQTASNKSIQISTHSFNKAKSLLKDVERNTHDKELTLTELVELCDNITGDNKNISNACIENNCDIMKTVERDKKESNTICSQSNESDLNKDNITYATAEESKGSLLIKPLFDTNNHENKRVPELNNYICKGFKTASNKEIYLSKNALARYKKVFQDIDLNETFNHQEPSTSKLSTDLISVERNFKNTDEVLKCLSKVTGAMEIDNEDKQEMHVTRNIENIIQEFECHDMLYTNVDMNESSYKDTFKFVGFKTASNKNIVISDDAFSKTKIIFQDVYLDNKENLKIHQQCGGKKEREVAIEICTENDNVFESRNNINKKQNKINMAPQEQHILDSKTVSNNQIKIFHQGLFKTKDVESIDYADIKAKEDNPNVNEYILTQDSISNNLNQPSTHKTPFPGFKTANNKEIKISKEALMKSKNLFQDIYNEYFFKYPPLSNEQNLAFNTFNDKENNFSEENCTTAGNIFYDLNEYFIQPSTSTKPFPGFKTANNKEITISKEALMKSKKLLLDIDNEKFCYTKQSPTSKKSGSKEEGTDFKAVNDKEFEIPEQTCSKTGDIFKDIDDKYFKQPTTTTEFLIGFKTANNKEIKISKQALAKTKNIFQDIHNDTINEPPNNLEINKCICLGFKTASNKEVRLSNEALAKTKHIFKDILDCHDENQDIASNIQIEKYPTFQGFQTASNKSVTISAEALSKTKHIFQDIDIPMEVSNRKPENDMKGIKQLDVRLKFQDFKTASNKKFTILDEALAKTREIFKGVNIEEDSTSTDIVHTPFKGFQTASNKKIEISENALVKTKNTFQDIDSAIYKKDISEVEINNYPKLLGDKLVDNEKQSGNKEIVFGFKTANNQTVEISEEALKQSKKIFTDIDAENDNKTISEQNHTIKHDTKTEINETCDDINIRNFINTQILNDFNDTLYTEDFCNDVTPNRSKRSGSPILSCPKAKKRKAFKTPLRCDREVDIIIDNPNFSVNKTENVYTFKENYKKNKAYTLKDLNKLEKEFSNNTQNSDLSKLKFNDLLDFQFPATRNDLTVVKMSVDELKKIFLMAVDRKIVPDGWLDNHIKLILWKLLSYEITFPNVMNNICTVKNVIEQLKYRYDRELYRVERPVLRKILEKDDTSLRTMVLCVMDIIEIDSSTDSAKNVELLVTDGWYCVKACIDRMLTKLVQDGKIVVGTKIVTNGAELLNCEQGVAPWEDTSAVRLKLFGNSTRRAPWHCRLGCHGNGAVSTRLSTVRVDGGKVSKLRVLVTRVYPPLYIEKFEDGSTVTRSERLQNLHEMKYETERQMLLEKIYDEVEKEFIDQDSPDIEMSIDTNNKRKYLDSGSQIAKMMKRSKDPVEFSTYLTVSQSELLVEYKSKRKEKLLQDIRNRVEQKMVECGININPKVIPLLKTRIVDIEERDGEIHVTKGMLSIWKPNDAIFEIIKEGVWIELLNVVPTDVRHSEIQISAGRQSIFHTSKYKGNEKIKLYTKNLERICYNIKNVIGNPTMNTDYNEIDTIGMIFHTEPSNEDFKFNKQPFQNVFLTDTEKNIIIVIFWGGIKKFGFENTLNVGEIVACINLQKRAGNTNRNIPQFRATDFTYFTKSPKNDSAKLLLEELSKKFLNINKQRFCEECLVLKNNFENISPYRLNNSEYNISKNRLFVDSPLPRKLNNIDKNLDLTGIDFESTFKQRDTQELSPNRLLRKKMVNEKIAKLKMYGEPPPLSPIHIINKSKDAGKAYKSPLLITNNVSDNIASTKVNLPKDFLKTTIEDTKNEEIQLSPVITTRKYEKRKNVKAVKLNFSNTRAMEENIKDTVDFDEDFDFSPPLSLD